MVASTWRQAASWKPRRSLAVAVERNRLAKFSVPDRTVVPETRSRSNDFLSRTLGFEFLHVVPSCTGLLASYPLMDSAPLKPLLPTTQL